MSQKVNLKHAGVVVQSSSGQPSRWGTSAQAMRRLRRFKAFAQETLRSPRESEGRLGALLVTMDGFLPSSLKSIGTQNAVPYRIEGGIALEWTADKPVRVERRLLCFITLDCWPKVLVAPSAVPSIVHLSATEKIVEDLEKFLKKSDAYRGVGSALMELELDVICWLQEVLPNSLFGHCAELLILSAVPRSAWARKETLQALSIPEVLLEEVADVGATCELMDATLVSHGADSGDAVLQSALDRLAESHSTIDAVNKRHWAKEFQKLGSRAIRAGPRNALLLAWAADLCESGTIEERNPADTTVKGYISRALLPLLTALRTLPDDMNSHEWGVSSLRARYQGLIESQTAGNQPTMRTALSNFHNFLVNWLDFEPLKVSLPGETQMVPVRAQVVWRHELDRAMVWADTHPDENMGGAARLILAIAFEAPIRAQELMRLRISSVRFCMDSVIPCAEIDIAHDAFSGRLKTPGSQRTLTIANIDTLQLLQDWIFVRINKGAPNSAYLFGDPSDDKLRYRPAATLGLVSQMLKATTGESLISLHTLRHTSISTDLSAIWNSTACVDLNRIEVVAAHAGHASGWTTLASYSHLYEHGLRMFLNAGMREQLGLDSNVAASIVGQTAANVRKSASRKGIDSSDYGWQLLENKAISMVAQPAAATFNFCEPRCPAIKLSLPRLFTVGVAESIVQDLIRGTDSSIVASRYGLSEDSLVKAIGEVVSAHGDLAEKIFPVKSARCASPSMTLPASIENIGVDFDRRDQMKFDALRLALDEEVNDHILKKGVMSWLACYRGTYLSLANNNAALGLFSLLKHCEVDSIALRICIQGEAPAKENENNSTASSSRIPENKFQWNPVLQRHSIAKTFVAVFGRQPSFTNVGFDRNRPRVYLQWDSNQKALENSASKGSTAGLNAMMICIQLYLSILKASE
jgi:integrase